MRKNKAIIEQPVGAHKLRRVKIKSVGILDTVCKYKIKFKIAVSLSIGRNTQKRDSHPHTALEAKLERDIPPAGECAEIRRIRTAKEFFNAYTHFLFLI